MNGPSLALSLTAMSPAGATGTLSAKPEAMLGNALPFRLQLEASTAPLSPLAGGAVLQRDDRFVMPGCLGDGFDPLAPDATGPGSPGLVTQTDHPHQDPGTPDSADTPLPALPLIFDMPHLAAPPVIAGAGHRPAGSPARRSRPADRAGLCRQHGPDCTRHRTGLAERLSRFRNRNFVRYHRQGAATGPQAAIGGQGRGSRPVGRRRARARHSGSGDRGHPCRASCAGPRRPIRASA